VLLALARRDADEAGREALQMEAALAEMGPGAVPEHAIMARFDLAKFWSGLNEHARAFGQWVAGHKLLARTQPFSRAEHRAFVDANIASFSAERFAGGPRARNVDPSPIFIVGMPRSGTTLAEQILAAHADVHGAGERAALGQAFAALGGGSGDALSVARLAALRQETLDKAAATYLRDLRALAPEKTRIVDKMPGNFNYLGLVGLMLPGARIIHYGFGGGGEYFGGTGGYGDGGAGGGHSGGMPEGSGKRPVIFTSAAAAWRKLSLACRSGAAG
jgi:Sulfotransferase family